MRSEASGVAPLEFSDVYDEHVGQVYGFFYYRLRDAADIEDLTQATFERALRAWGRYDPARASAATWLLVIARNLLVDHLRSGRKTRERSLEALELTGDHAVLAGSPDRHDLGLSPELERALEQLNDRERELIALRFGGDLSCPEIADATGLSLSNVQQILSRSLRRMRSTMEPARPPAMAVRRIGRADARST